jgi:hypothetical protein
MHIYQRVAAFLVCIPWGFCVPSCGAQLWKDLDGGFGCQSMLSIGYELAVDEIGNQLLLSGDLPFTRSCETWRMPAKWNGKHWNRLGDVLETAGAGQISFKTIGVYNGEIYSANPLKSYSNSCFIKWNGINWDTIAGGPASFSLYCMIEHDNFLYVSGAFNYCEGDSANLVFRYDGEKVEPLVDFFGDVEFGLTMAFYHDTLFVGGSFRDYERDIYHFASVYNNNIHKETSMITYDAIIETMCVHDDVLWLGGCFNPGNFGLDKQTFLAYYDGKNIYPSPWQPNGRVVSLKSYNNELYMAGWFSQIEDKESHGIAKINDFGYFSLNTDTMYNKAGEPRLTGMVRDMEIWKDTLYLAGAFGSIGKDTTLNTIAKLNRSLSGQNQLMQGDISVYPNPTHDQIKLETAAYFNQPALIKLYDSLGRQVIADSWPAGEKRKQIAMENLENGVYVVVVATTAGNVMIKRIIKV